MPSPRYIELHARSAFSFLRGASEPERLTQGAARVDLSTLAVCDRDGVYGTPRVYAAAKKAGIRPIIGVELTLEDATVLPVLVANRAGYQNLARRSTPRSGGTNWRSMLDVFTFARNHTHLDLAGPLLTANAPNDRSPLHQSECEQSKCSRAFDSFAMTHTIIVNGTEFLAFDWFKAPLPVAGVIPLAPHVRDEDLLNKGVSDPRPGEVSFTCDQTFVFDTTLELKGVGRNTGSSRVKRGDMLRNLTNSSPAAPRASTIRIH